MSTIGINDLGAIVTLTGSIAFLVTYRHPADRPLFKKICKPWYVKILSLLVAALGVADLVSHSDLLFGAVGLAGGVLFWYIAIRLNLIHRNSA
jgi:hypothetical protein